MEVDPNLGSRSSRPPAGTSVLVLVTVLVAFLALDDLTTDEAVSFGFERLALLCCWGWLLVLSARLMRDHYWLGLVSVGLLGLAGPALRAIGPGTRPGLSFEYLGAVAFLTWFTVLSIWLAVLGWRSRRSTAV